MKSMNSGCSAQVNTVGPPVLQPDAVSTNVEIAAATRVIAVRVVAPLDPLFKEDTSFKVINYPRYGLTLSPVRPLKSLLGEHYALTNHIASDLG
ncbi:Pyrroline-5-carboxylate reductase [Fusarium oxysporum f. sp. albedinis]|nr:Pyrroline-5-carboxylate reductase [Fusarium oxysporum f. sp. albedinis]